MHFHKRKVALSALLLASCSKNAPAPVTPEPPPRTGAVFSVTQAVEHGPSDVILKKWTVPPDGDAIVYADLGALFGSELIHGMLVEVLRIAHNGASEESSNCVLQWASSVREALVWAKGNDGLVVATYEPSALKTPIGTCIEGFGAMPQAEIGTARQAYALNNGVIVVLPNMVLLGTRSLVEASLSSTAPNAWPRTVGLKPDQQIAFIGQNGESLNVKGALSVTAQHFIVHTDVTFANPDEAKAAAEFVAPERLQRELLEVSAQMQNVALMIGDCWHVKQEGRLVRFDFTMQGDMKVIAAKLGMLSAMGIYGVRKYVVHAKTVEARMMLGRIAKDLVESKPKKLSAFPPVPSNFDKVQGAKYRSVPSDWAKWKPIGFTIGEPQYYQYRVEAAKDGKSAEIIAEGDLDGNGKKSHFSLSIKLDPKSHEFVIAPIIKEQDAEE